MKIFVENMLEKNLKMLFHVLEIVVELVGSMEVGVKYVLTFFEIFYYHMDVYSVFMMVVVYVNVQRNVEMQVTYQYHHIIVFRILFLILNDVRRQLVIKHDGILPHGLMYVGEFIIFFEI